MAETNTEVNGKISKAIIDFLILNVPIFSKLKDKELRIVEKHMQLIDVIPGEVIFQEGDKGDYVCFVLEGSLDVLKKSETAEEIVISTLSRGRSIGEMSVIDELPRSATVKSRTKATLLTLSRDKFNYLLENHSGIGVKILKSIARLLSLNLRKTSTKLVDYMLPIV